MMRVIGIGLLAAVVGVAAYVYDVKYATGRLNRQAADLTRQIERERDMIAALRAEWSALEQPARLQQLTERHLGHLRPFTVAQMALAHEIPDRPLDLGLFIESLAARGGLPQLGPDAGSPRGATRTPVVMPLPVPTPSPFRR
jgi:cell division protein FtsL